MKKSQLIVFISAMLVSTISFAQIREIPKAVEETFLQQYDSATNVEYIDQIVRVDVRFELNGEKMLASYTNKGVWKETEKEWSFDKLPQDILDGFNKSKFADREVEETKVLYLPGGIAQYRLKARKSGVEKKYLFFNTRGRLLRTAITI